MTGFRVTQHKSLAGSTKSQRETIRSLGLRRPEEIAKLRGLSVDAVLGLGGRANGEAPAAEAEESPAEDTRAEETPAEDTPEAPEEVPA